MVYLILQQTAYIFLSNTKIIMSWYQVVMATIILLFYLFKPSNLLTVLLHDLNFHRLLSLFVCLCVCVSCGVFEEIYKMVVGVVLGLLKIILIIIIIMIIIIHFFLLILLVLVKQYSDITSFFRVVNERASYLFGIISLAYAPVNVTDFSIDSINCVRPFPQT